MIRDFASRSGAGQSAGTLSFRNLYGSIVLVILGTTSSITQEEIPNASLSTGEFHWQASEPLVSLNADRLPASPTAPWIAIKDPSVIRDADAWHLFCTLRKKKNGDGRIRIGYLSFRDWEQANLSQWSVLELTNGYHGAPQIFYFAPHRKWYLIYQAEDQSRGLKYGPCFSTNSDLRKPQQWTKPEPLYTVPKGVNAGLDFWVICDQSKAHLFFTTLDGKMWRSWTALGSFPNRDWSTPKVVLEADIFEASHTYRIKGFQKFITLVEAQDGRRRYFKAFVADRLDGQWNPLAVSKEKAFASPRNVEFSGDAWSDSFSHGELIRAGVNQELEINPDNLQFLFQGVSNSARGGRDYGAIPWQVGILKQK